MASSATPEGKVKKAIKEYLTNIGAWYFLPVSNGMGAHGIPDFVCCLDGRFFCIEAKAPGKLPTKLQLIVHRAIAAAGGRVFVIDGDFAELGEWVSVDSGVG